jgi:hypothetical protein
MGDVEGIGSEIGLGDFGDGRENPLARQRVPHEDDAAVGGSRDAAAAGRDRTRLELKELAFGHEGSGESCGALGGFVT